MANLKVHVEVEEDMPLQTYIIQYLNFLHDNVKKAEVKLETFVLKMIEDESVHISQIVRDHEITRDINMDKLTGHISDINFTLSNKLDVVKNTITNDVNEQILNMTLIMFEDLKQSVDNVERKINTNLKDQVRNATLVSEQLNQFACDSQSNLSKKIDKLEIKLTEVFDDKILNVKQECVIENINTTRKLKNHILNLTQVSEQLNQAVSDSRIKLSEKIEDIDAKFETLSKKCDSAISNLEEKLDAQIMRTKNLSAAIVNREERARLEKQDGRLSIKLIRINKYIVISNTTNIN